LPQRGNWPKPVDAPLFSCYNTKRYGVKMTIKLLLLKSGEDIISDVTEMMGGHQDNPTVIGYFLDKPCVVKMHNNLIQQEVNTETTEGREEKKGAYQVSLFPWMPLSKEEKIPVVAEWVITMTTPVDKLEEMYIEEVIDRAKNNQNSSIAE